MSNGDDRGESEQERSERLHHEHDPHYLTEDDLFGIDDLDGDWSDESHGSCYDWSHESHGSCYWCGTDLHTGDYDGLCEQCAWHASRGEGSPDVGSGGAL